MYKRLVAILLVAVMIVGIIPLSYATGVSTCTFTITADREAAEVGEEITFTVSVQQTGTLNTFGFVLVIPEGLTYVDNSGSVDENAASTLGWTD